MASMEKLQPLLTPLIPRFTEGLGTHALRDASSLLKSIGATN